MEKSKKLSVSPGVRALGLEPMLLQVMFRKAVSFYPKYDILVFEPRDGRIIVSDINQRKLDEIRNHLPEEVWIETCNYGDYYLLKVSLLWEI